MPVELKKRDALVAEIESLLSNGNNQASVKLCQILNNSYPSYGHGWFLSSFVAAQLNIVDYALYCINNALTLSNKNINWQIQKANCLVKLGDFSQAIELVDNAMQISQKDIKILNDIAIIYNNCHQLEKSRETYMKAIVLSPKSSKLYFNLASVERYLGLLVECEKNCNLAIEYDVNNYDAYYMRSNLRSLDLKNNHINQLYQVINSQISNPSDFAKMQFALAKELEDCGQYKESFIERKKGADKYRKVFNYNVQSEIDFMRNIAFNYDFKMFEDSKDNTNGEGLIFILGLPRTGSTLLERIMSGHSEISSMGELTAFSNIMSEMLVHLVGSNGASDSEMVRMSKSLDFNKLGQSYMQYINSVKGSSKYFIDKFPQNSLYIGLIKLALPRARIVLIERDPMDSCYSMYKQLFTDIYQFSYDLDELSDYFISHHQLMNHWKTILADDVITVKYEDLVGDIHTASINLFNKCKIQWQPQCVDFTKNIHHSMTASASQVRQGLYSSSIGKWKNYKVELSEVSKKVMNYLNKLG